MNWLGKMILKYISKKDIVLDMGCGIMPDTTIRQASIISVTI